MYMSPYSYMHYGLQLEDIFPALAGAAGAVLSVLITIYLLTFAFAILCYVFESLSFYQIAKRRGIRHAWLAWLPIGNLWIMGSISDQYKYVTAGKIQSRRKILMGLTIAILACSLLLGVGIGVLAAGAVVEESAMALTGGAILGVSGLAVWVMTVILAVFEYIVIYNIFASCEPANATLFLVLSILFSVTLPFFLFACRKKDLGMPPRTVNPVQPTFQPPVEPAPEEPTTAEPVNQDPPAFTEE